MSTAMIRQLLLLAALIAAWQPSKARASEEDTQFYLNAIATGAIGDGTTMTVDATQRWRQDARGGNQSTLRVTIERKVDKAARVGGGIGVFETASGLTEIRVHQQATIKLGRIESRTRMEERFFDGADQVELRLRQRFTYIQPLAKNWRATAGVEWLGLVQSRVAGRGFSTDQWRGQAAIIHRVNPQFEVGAIYWLVDSPRGDRTDRINHIPQAVVTYHF